MHADVIRKSGVAADARQPVILAIGPYFAHIGMTPEDADPTRRGPNVYYTELVTDGKLFDRGYTLVQVDLRGFGGSEGCNDFGGKGEQADVKAAVEWAASQPWSNGKVGMFGKSYDGWTLAMALATKPKGLAAIVIQAPVLSGYRALYMNGVHYALGWYATPAVYQATDALPPAAFDSPEYIRHSALGFNPACYALNIALQTGLADRDDGAGFWQQRDLIERASGSAVPTFWEHGFVDANAKLDNFLDVYSVLRGPHRVWAGQWAHERLTEALVGRKGFYDEAMRWFDRYVKGLPEQQAPVGSDPGAEIQDGGTHKWRAEAVWPPPDAAGHDLSVRPGTHVNVPGNSASGD
ncbi:MAG TPA: CocE/NonD family hydrolase, partial [Solirubrobacteraceae bacterium]